MKDPKEVFFFLLSRTWKYFHFPFLPLEKNRVIDHRDKGKELSPIFIIGPPRCGSTFLYQLLTEHFLTEYIDNLTHAFYKTLFLGNKLSHLLYDDRAHGIFSSKGGRTVQEGWHAPSECPPFWYRAIPKELHYVRKEDLSEHEQRLLADPLHAIMGRTGRPILIKNLFAVERLGLLRSLFPHARFLILERDRLAMARSILQERQRLRIREDRWWSVRPRNYRNFEDRSVEEKTAAQVHYIEEQIEEELSDLPGDQKVKLSYEKVAEDPKAFLSNIKKGILRDLEWRSFSTDLSSFPQKVQKDPSKESGWSEQARTGFLKLGLPYEREEQGAT